MAYAEGKRPTKRFGVVLVDRRTNKIHVVHEVTAHDAPHAAELARARVGKTFLPQRLRLSVHSVYKGRLKHVPI